MINKTPFLIVILSMISGIFIAILFGVNEGYFKNSIKEGLKENVKVQSIMEPEVKAKKLKSEADKNWRYYQRFHFHSTGISAMSLGLLLFLTLLQAPIRLKLVSSYMVSIGGFFYPFVWLFAGIFGPSMGRHEAKESFAIFGYMGGIFLLGCVLILFLAAKYPIRIKDN